MLTTHCSPLCRLAGAILAVGGLLLLFSPPAEAQHHGHGGHHGGHYGHHGGHSGHGHSYGHRGHSYGHYGGRSYGGYGYARSYGYRPSYGYSSYRPYSRNYYGYSPRSYGGGYGYQGYSPRSYGYGGGYSAVSPRSSEGYGDSSAYAQPPVTSGYRGATAQLGAPYAQSSVRPGESYGASDATTYGGGWAQLAGGQSDAALSSFAQQAEAAPQDGVPKVGFALAAAAGGDYTLGTWAMRRACRIDPESMSTLKVNHDLKPSVNRLIAIYQGQTASDAHSPDPQFMLASLQYLNGDVDAAQEAISHALAYGDRSASATNLKSMIEQQVSTTGGEGQRIEPFDAPRLLEEPPLPSESLGPGDTGIDPPVPSET